MSHGLNWLKTKKFEKRVSPVKTVLLLMISIFLSRATHVLHYKKNVEKMMRIHGNKKKMKG